jgi:hypothetical protein
VLIPPYTPPAPTPTPTPAPTPDPLDDEDWGLDDDAPDQKR